MSESHVGAAAKSDVVADDVDRCVVGVARMLARQEGRVYYDSAQLERHQVVQALRELRKIYPIGTLTASLDGRITFEQRQSSADEQRKSDAVFLNGGVYPPADEAFVS